MESEPRFTIDHDNTVSMGMVKEWVAASKDATKRQSRDLGSQIFDQGNRMMNAAFIFEGEEFFGLPLDPRRAIDGYLRPGDRVFCWGHVQNHLYSHSDIRRLCRIGRSSADLSELCKLLLREASSWPSTGVARHNWDSQMDEGLGFSVIDELRHINIRDSIVVDAVSLCNIASCYSIATSCLALPLSVHLQRVEELGCDWPSRWHCTPSYGNPGHVVSADG